MRTMCYEEYIQICDVWKGLSATASHTTTAIGAITDNRGASRSELWIQGDCTGARDILLVLCECSTPICRIHDCLTKNRLKIDTFVCFQTICFFKRQGNTTRFHFDFPVTFFKISAKSLVRSKQPSNTFKPFIFMLI